MSSTTGIEIAYQVTLLVSTLCTSFLFSAALVFAIVIMPGISALDDKQYLRVFQVVDKIIQDFQPIFSLLWLGTIPSSILALILGSIVYNGNNPSMIVMLVIAVSTILIGQVATIKINIPLNNRVQELDCLYLDTFVAKQEREKFERTWCRSNTFRTWIFFVAFALQLVLLLRAVPVKM